eukprot:576266-Lingulodinium_polyedra.AAC.1
MALATFLLYHLKCRLVPMRDIYHREWNDVKLALKKSDLWYAVLLSTLAFNLPYGPWDGAGWFSKLQDSAKALMEEESIASP